MTHDEFERLIKKLDGDSSETLCKKNRMYSSGEDALHNFNNGAEIFGGTPAETCWGYLTKHLVALRDKVKNNDFSDVEDFMEKCQDSINYIRILWCIGNEANKNLVTSDEYPRRVKEENPYMDSKKRRIVFSDQFVFDNFMLHSHNLFMDRGVVRVIDVIEYCKKSIFDYIDHFDDEYQYGWKCYDTFMRIISNDGAVEIELSVPEKLYSNK